MKESQKTLTTVKVSWGGVQDIGWQEQKSLDYTHLVFTFHFFSRQYFYFHDCFFQEACIFLCPCFLHQCQHLSTPEWVPLNRHNGLPGEQVHNAITCGVKSVRCTSMAGSPWWQSEAQGITLENQMTRDVLQASAYHTAGESDSHESKNTT